MTSLENLHTAIGELAYAIARSDGAIQKEEREKFLEIVSSEMKNERYNFDISGIIFQILDRDKFIDAKTSYEWAIKEIRMNSHYLSPELKDTFLRVITQVAKAYPPVTVEEENLIERFKKDLEPMKGDPVYYEQKS